MRNRKMRLRKEEYEVEVEKRGIMRPRKEE